MDEETFDTYGKFGYYSQEFKLRNGKDVEENVRIIGMNTQTCNTENWYLIENRYDPGDQLAFIESELSKLEQVNGSAIFIAHIPPVYCLHPWGARFRALAERYQHVIKFSMFGHTHKEMYEVVRSFDDQNIGVNYINPSFSDAPIAYPGFTLIEIDQEFMLPLNFRVHIMDLPESNIKKIPIFREQNDFINFYGLEDVSPNSLFSLSERILNDEATAMAY